MRFQTDIWSKRAENKLLLNGYYTVSRNYDAILQLPV
jgi:hypothetical protein